MEGPKGGGGEGGVETRITGWKYSVTIETSATVQEIRRSSILRLRTLITILGAEI